MADENRKYIEYRSKPTLTAFSESATSQICVAHLKKVSDMTNTNLISQNDSHLTVNDLQVIDDEPRIKDIVLGERLGFERPRKVREIIERNIKELQAFERAPHGGATHDRRAHLQSANEKAGSCPLQMDTEKVCTLSFVTTTEKVGCVMRPVKTYYLNEAQALLLCMFSRTAKAAQVRKELIDVYMAYRTRGLAKVREHYRQVATKPKLIKGYSPNIKDCQIITIDNNALNKTFNIGEMVVAARVPSFSGSGIYAIHRLDYKPDLYRCIETADGKIKMSRDNGDPEYLCTKQQFNELNCSKVVSIFKCLDLYTEGYENLKKYLLRVRKPRARA